MGFKFFSVKFASHLTVAFMIQISIGCSNQVLNWIEMRMRCNLQSSLSPKFAKWFEQVEELDSLGIVPALIVKCMYSPICAISGICLIITSLRKQSLILVNQMTCGHMRDESDTRIIPSPISYNKTTQLQQ